MLLVVVVASSLLPSNHYTSRGKYVREEEAKINVYTLNSNTFLRSFIRNFNDIEKYDLLLILKYPI